MGVVTGAAKTAGWEIGFTFQGWLQHLFVCLFFFLPSKHSPQLVFTSCRWWPSWAFFKRASTACQPSPTASMSLVVPGIWSCVHVSLKQPRKCKCTVTGLTNLYTVSSWMTVSVKRFFLLSYFICLKWLLQFSSLWFICGFFPYSPHPTMPGILMIKIY